MHILFTILSKEIKDGNRSRERRGVRVIEKEIEMDRINERRLTQARESKEIFKNK